MAYFLFVDESGQDRRESPYEVLAGIAVQDLDLWNLIDAVKNAELQILGLRYSREKEEFKGKKFLKKKAFRQALEHAPIEAQERRVLAAECLRNGPSATSRHRAALAQAKLAFASEVFALCNQHRCRLFASVVTREAPRPSNSYLRKDYAFLFERYFYFLEDRGPNVQGLVVFDELEKSQSHILVGQMEEYFLRTKRGRERSRQVIPEPFFVHSDLTSMVQVADLAAYVISWGLRIPGLEQPPARPELSDLADQVYQLRYRAVRELMGREDFVIWSLAVIKDLRGWQDRLIDDSE